VIVFDPLAVCLVLATSFAIKQRESHQPGAHLSVVQKPAA